MHMQNFIEICLFILKILTKKDEVSPLAIPYPSPPPPISMSTQSLKKIGQNVLKLEHGNEALTDRRTTQTDGRRTDKILLKCKILLKFVYSFLRY